MNPYFLAMCGLLVEHPVQSTPLLQLTATNTTVDVAKAAATWHHRSPNDSNAATANGATNVGDGKAQEVLKLFAALPPTEREQVLQVLQSQYSA